LDAGCRIGERRRCSERDAIEIRLRTQSERKLDFVSGVQHPGRGEECENYNVPHAQNKSEHALGRARLTL
jgi:hypothetical protein